MQHSAAELGDAEQTGLFGDESEKPKRHAWAWLLGKMFVVDVTARSTATERQARFGAHADREGRSRDSLPATGRAASALPQEEWLKVCTESRDIQRVLAAAWACSARPARDCLGSAGAAALARFDGAQVGPSACSPWTCAQAELRLQLEQEELFGKNAAPGAL